MATITTRSGKGSPLTNTEVDANFTNLNTDKVETSALDQSVLSGATPNFGIANMSIDDTNLKVVDVTSLQSFVDGIDHSVLKDRGTGVSATYVSTVAVGGTTFAQPEVFGEINSDQGYFDIHFTGATNVTVATLSNSSTYVYIDKNGALQQQVTTPTRQDWSRKIFTMRIAVDVANSVILGFEYFNNPIGNYSNSIRDVYEYLLAQGVPFKKNQTITGRAGDLGFDVSAGTILEFGGTGDINNPNIVDFNAIANASFFLSTRTVFDAGGNTDLPKLWDNNGTLTALGSTTLVGHRLYRFSNGNLCLQYGQGNYANMVLAKAGVLLEDYVLNPSLENATFFGWWFIESTATNTGGTTLTDFVEYTIGVQGGSSSSLAGALLKGNNLSDLIDAATARTNLGLGTGDSPTFAALTSTGTVTATGGNSTNWNTAYGWGNHASESYATETYVGTAISNLVDSSPATLDTLNELAAALGDDPNFATTVTNSIATKLPLAGGTLTGALTTANSVKVTGIASSNSSPAADQVELSGYGLIGNRNKIYITNADASGQIVMGISGAHNANPKLTVATSGITVGGTVTATGGNSTNWNTAYGWGNHASAGYTNNVGDITGVTAGTGLTGGGTSGTPTLNVIGGDGITANADNITVDSTVIRTTGNQSMSGVKTFTGDTAWTDGNSFYVAGAGGGRVSLPAGASYFSSSGTHTGAVKIKLPTASKGKSDMISLEVTIFDYALDESVKLLINAYHYSTVNWNNQSVVTLASQTGKDYIVRFGSDATSHCLWIGETTSVWAHPQVSVSNFMCGFSANAADYVDGWSISFVTAFDTVQDTVTSSLPMAQYAQDADKLDGQQGSYYYAASNPNGYTSNVGDITGVTAGTGLTGGGTSGTPTLNVIGGDGITANADNITVDSTVIRTTGNQSMSGVKTFTGSVVATGGNSTNWNTAHGWGNHASQSYATQSYVGTAISNLVDSSPAALDTLNELAAALGDDPNFATTVTNSIATKLPLAGGTLTGGLTISESGTPSLVLNDTGNGGGGGASSKILFSNTSGNAMGFGYTADDTASSDLIMSTNAAGTYGGYLGLDVSGINDPSDIILEPKNNVRIVTGNLQIGSTTVIDSSRNLTNIGTISSGVITATGGNSTNWNTAHGWGNHASAGYTSNVGDITGVTAGTGLTGGGTSGTPTLNVIGGDGITANANDIAVDSTVIRTTGAQSMSGVKTFTTSLTTPIVTATTTQNRTKLRVWNSSTYGMGMHNAHSFGGLNNDYAMTFQMNNDSDRGFWWGDDNHTNAQGAMSLTTNGKLSVASGIRVGYGETDTTSPAAGLTVSGNIAVTGTVDGRNVATDGTKLDGIASGATANTGDITAVTAGTGLTGGATSGAATLNVICGDGITANADDIAVDSTVIRTTGTQTIGGAKTFSDGTIYMAGNLAHVSDTNTYMGFHANDQWRVVTGGTERLECNNSYVGVSGSFRVANKIEHWGDSDTYMSFDAGDQWKLYCGGLKMIQATESGTGYDYISFGGTDNSGEILFNLAVGDGHFDGNLYAYSTTTSSDRKLKKNIQPLEGALEKVQNLRGVSFEWKKDDKKSIGFIAQEVQEVVPDLVKLNRKEHDGVLVSEHLGVDYGNITALLVEAMKEQQETINKLEARILALEKGEK